MNALNNLYTITVDPDKKIFLELTLNWDYVKAHVDISMPGYIKKMLTYFQHVARCCAQHSPHEWQTPTYGQKTQYAKDDDSPPVSLTIKKTLNR